MPPKRKLDAVSTDTSSADATRNHLQAMQSYFTALLRPQAEREKSLANARRTSSNYFTPLTDERRAVILSVLDEFTESKLSDIFNIVASYCDSGPPTLGVWRVAAAAAAAPGDRWTTYNGLSACSTDGVAGMFNICPGGSGLVKKKSAPSAVYRYKCVHAYSFSGPDSGQSMTVDGVAWILD